MRQFKQKHIPRPKQGSCVSLDKLQPPFDLEIGCGTGEFAIQLAELTKNPVIAIEKTRKRFLKFKKRYDKLKSLTNLWPVHTNAVWWLVHYGRKNSFEQIFLLYPNPYPKIKQAHLRWINRSFMPFLLNLLREEGKLHLRTNKNYYYQEFKEKIKEFPFMHLEEDRMIQDTSQAQSLFEKKYLERGENCHVLKYRKTFKPNRLILDEVLKKSEV